MPRLPSFLPHSPLKEGISFNTIITPILRLGFDISLTISVHIGRKVPVASTPYVNTKPSVSVRFLNAHKKTEIFQPITYKNSNVCISRLFLAYHEIISSKSVSFFSSADSPVPPTRDAFPELPEQSSPSLSLVQLPDENT